MAQKRPTKKKQPGHQTRGSVPAAAAEIVRRKWKTEDMVNLINVPMFREKICSN